MGLKKIHKTVILSPEYYRGEGSLSIRSKDSSLRFATFRMTN